MAKMFLYSCLGVLTLQIGVSVLAALFLGLAAILTISNFTNVDTQFGIVPYIVLGVFIVLLLLAGLLMFFASYKERKGVCMYAIIFVVLILIFFWVGSVISFLNMPSMTKYVCTYDNHCPESLWISSLNYRKTSNDSNDETDQTDEPGSNTTIDIITTPSTLHSTVPDEQANFEGRHRKGNVRKQRKIYHTNLTKETYYTNVDTPQETVWFTFMDSEIYKNYTANESDTKRSQKEIVWTETSGLNAPNNRSSIDYKDNKGILKIVRKGLSSFVKYVKGKEEPDEKPILKDAYDMVDEDEDTDYSMEETDGSGYVFGYEFFVAIICFLLLTIFFIFTIIVLWSFRKQLVYIKLYAEDPASKHYLTES